MSLACLRSFFLPAFLASLLVLSGAFYLEYGLGQVACPMCQAQRLMVSAFSLLCLIGLVHRPTRPIERRYLWSCLVLTLLGGLLAVRQVWLQGLSVATETACVRSLSYLVEQGTVGEWLAESLLGSAGCVPITWSFLDLSVPEWSVLAFLGLGVMVVYRLVVANRLNSGQTAQS